MNQQEIKQDVKHIKDVHSSMYTVTELKWFLANEKALVRIARRTIKEKQKDIKYERKSLLEYYAKVQAYKEAIKIKEKQKGISVSDE